MSISSLVRRRIFIALLVLGAALVVAAACNGDDGDDGDGEAPAATPTPAPEETPAAGGETPAAGETPVPAISPQPDVPQEVEAQLTEAADGVIETDMGDNFYTRNNLKVGLGKTVTISGTNEGVAVHNFRIAGVDGEWNTDDDVVSDPDAVRAGETGVLEFTPEAAGTFTFRCDFHPLEMGGVIVVG